MTPQLLAFMVLLVPIIASASIIPQQHSGIQSYRVSKKKLFINFWNFIIYYIFLLTFAFLFLI